MKSWQKLRSGFSHSGPIWCVDAQHSLVAGSHPAWRVKFSNLPYQFPVVYLEVKESVGFSPKILLFSMLFCHFFDSRCSEVELLVVFSNIFEVHLFTLIRERFWEKQVESPNREMRSLKSASPRWWRKQQHRRSRQLTLGETRKHDPYIKKQKIETGQMVL